MIRSMLVHSTKPRPFLNTFPPCDMSSCCTSRWLPSKASCTEQTVWWVSQYANSQRPAL